MSRSFIRSPIDQYLQQGISASQAIQLLQDNDCLTFPQLRSGLFPAALFDDPEKDQTGMTNAWLRDSACVGLVLLETEQKEAAVKAAVGILSCLHKVQESFKAIVAQGHAPSDDRQRPPIRFAGQDSQPRYDWANSQNDAIGYSLQLIGAAVSRGLVVMNADDTDLIDDIVQYLDAIEYWQDADSGHWEETKKVNASSIGTVLAGLRSMREIVTDKTQVTAMIEKGHLALEAILPFESVTTGLERPQDLALLFLVEPQHVVSDEMAAHIVEMAENKLMGEYGFRRYLGDSYWGPNYREHFPQEDRTADYSDSDDMKRRDSFSTNSSEAQWTLADPIIATYYARQYQKNGELEDAQKAHDFIIRSLRSIVSLQDAGSNKAVWRIPELYFLEDNEWVPNDHLGLLWAQANVLRGLMVYEEVFQDSLIKS